MKQTELRILHYCRGGAMMVKTYWTSYWYVHVVLFSKIWGQMLHLSKITAGFLDFGYIFPNIMFHLL